MYAIWQQLSLSFFLDCTTRILCLKHNQCLSQGCNTSAHRVLPRTTCAPHLGIILGLLIVGT